jgi:co-chaperonin GroES (HSP10)
MATTTTERPTDEHFGISRQSILDMDPATIVPHGDRYLIELIDVERAYWITDGFGQRKRIQVEGGESLEERNGYYFARIISKGNGHRLEVDVMVPMPFDPGDVVMVEKFSGREVEMGAKKYRILNQTDVLAHMPALRPA